MRYGMLAFLMVAVFTAACGQSVLRTQSTVLHPLHAFKESDTEAPRTPRLAVIMRRENRVTVAHSIVGPQGRPMALEILGEFAEIPPQNTDGSSLFVEVLIFSNYKDELSSMGNYAYWLELPDGRRVEGDVHVQGPREDHSMKITGAHSEVHGVVRDREAKTITAYRHIEEVENDLELYSRWARILFSDRTLIVPETAYVIFVVRGYGRERRYRFDFTYDPYKALEAYERFEK